MKKPVVLLFFLSSSFSLVAQTYISGTDPGFRTGANAVFSVYKPADREIDGDPYLNGKWNEGTVTFKNGDAIKIDRMNYNIYTNTISYFKDGQVYNSTNDKDIKKFTIGNKKFIYATIGTKSTRNIFELLSDGDIQLLKRYEIKIIQGKPSNGFVVATNDRYTNATNYYYRQTNMPAVEIKTKNKKVLEVLSKEKDLLKKHIKEKKLNARNEEELVSIFNFYNDQIE